MPDLSREAFAGRASDAWVRYAHDNARRIANLPHFVGDHEFAFRPLALRRDAWVIVGINYAARADARRTLEAAGVRVRPENPTRRHRRALRRFGLYGRNRSWYSSSLIGTFA